ncbi:GAF domain-containing protein [Paraflavitalea speifideaquila]|uniref:GAF domain-containing protein n=1 Tax=Paraflavitalea speifideaquila TaxID=3076558 RepID=UPI0028F141CE|nr:GAF domain-containing protein [Paraflavitalea speifideiaquila]
MKKQILDYSGADWQAQQLSCALSFEPFLRWLRKRIGEEKTAKRRLYEMALEQFEAHDKLPAAIPVDQVFEYAELLEWIYTCITPAAQPEEEIMWSLWVPARPLLFYGTNAFYELIQQHKIDLHHRTPEDFRREQLQMVYTFILRKLYHFHPRLNEYYHAYLNPATGLLQYYTIHINAQFIDVTTDGPLPPLDLRNLNDLLQVGAGYEVLENILPLQLFRFKGISVSTITDVTAQRSLENLRQVHLTQASGDASDALQDVIRSLKTLVRSNNIEFDLFPMVQVNGKYVYGYEVGGSGILYSVWGDQTLTPEEFQLQAAGYAANPRSFFSPDIHQEEASKNKWLTHFIEANVRSMATTPVFNERTMVGTVCMYTLGDDQFDEKTVGLLETALPSIAQLLQVFIDSFNLEINNIIREKYTAIQPAVQWKFREAAWHHLYQTKNNCQLPITRSSLRPFIPCMAPWISAIPVWSGTRPSKPISAPIYNYCTIPLPACNRCINPPSPNKCSIPLASGKRCLRRKY